MQTRQVKSHSPNTSPTKTVETPPKAAINATSATRVPAWASGMGDQLPTALLPDSELTPQRRVAASEPLELQDQSSMAGLNSEQRKINNNQVSGQRVQSGDNSDRPSESVKQEAQKARVTPALDNSSQPARISNLPVTVPNAPRQSASSVTTSLVSVPTRSNTPVSMTSPASSTPQQSIPASVTGSTMASSTVSPIQLNVPPASAVTATTQSVELPPTQIDNRYKLETSNHGSVLSTSSITETKTKPVYQDKSKEDNHSQVNKANSVQSSIIASTVNARPKSKSKEDSTSKYRPSGEGSVKVRETASSKAGITSKSVDVDEAETPKPMGESLNEELNNFMLQVRSKQEELASGAEQKKGQIHSAADEEKNNLATLVELQAKDIKDVYNNVMSCVETSAENTRLIIFDQRDAKIEDTNQNAREELDNLDKLFAEKADTLRKIAEEKAKVAIDGGHKQAGCAQEGSKEKSTRVFKIAENKVEQYKNYNRANRIASVARDLGADLADKIKNTGDELVATAENDANDLAIKFRNEAEDAIDKFTDKKQEFQDQIEQQRVSTVQGLNQIATDSVSQLESSAQNILAELEAEKQAAVQQIRNFVPGGKTSIDQVADAACTKVDQQITQAIEQLGSFVTSVQKMLGQARGETARKHLRDAQAQVDVALATYEMDMDRLTGDSTQAIQKVSSEFYQQVSGQVDQLVEPVKQFATDFEAKAKKAMNDVKVAMEDIASGSAKTMHGTVTDAEKLLQEAIDQSEQEWAKELAQGLDQIKNKVDVGLTKYDEALTNLGSKIDEQAEKIEHASVIERIWDWVVGIVESFFEALWEFVKIVLVALLVVLAVLLIIGIIVAIFAGIAAAIEVIVTIVAGIAAVLEAIGGILLVIGKILAVVAAVRFIYLAITRDDLSDRERSKLVGKATFEIVLGFFGEKIAKALGEWFQSMARFSRLKGIVGDEARLARLLEAVDGDEILLEELLKLTGNNAERLGQLLDKVGDAKLLKSLFGRTDSITQLEKLLSKTGDVKQLNELLSKADSAAQLEKLLDKTNDVAQLEKLLGKTKNASQLEMLLDKAGDTARLDTLLNKVSDADQLERLFARIDDPIEVERLLDKSGLRPGDAPNPLRLERVLDKMPPGKPSIADIEKELDAKKIIDNKILYGRPAASPTPGTLPTGEARRIIGGHSPNILSDPKYTIVSQTVNSDGTINVKFTTGVSPSPVISKLKTSTLAPPSWTDNDILLAGEKVAKTPPVYPPRPGGDLLHRDVINGIQWEVITKPNGEIIGSYPLGDSTPLSLADWMKGGGSAAAGSP